MNEVRGNLRFIRQAPGWLSFGEPEPTLISVYVVPETSLSFETDDLQINQFATNEELLELTPQAPSFKMKMLVPTIDLAFDEEAPGFRYNTVTVPVSSLVADEQSVIYRPMVMRIKNRRLRLIPINEVVGGELSGGGTSSSGGSGGGGGGGGGGSGGGSGGSGGANGESEYLDLADGFIETGLNTGGSSGDGGSGGFDNSGSSDLDGDGVPDSQDSDMDGDGLPNDQDSDMDGDSIPNDQDSDMDGDNVPNESDLDVDADGMPNAYDSDIDGDGIDNADDEDIDGDGTPNETDETPYGPSIPGIRGVMNMQVGNTETFVFDEQSPDYKILRLELCPVASMGLVSQSVSAKLRSTQEALSFELAFQGFSFKGGFLKLLRMRYQQRNERLLTTSYSLTVDIKGLYTAAYDLLNYNPISSIKTFGYKDSLSVMLESSYQDNPLLNKIVEASYSDCSIISSISTSTYNDNGIVYAIRSFGYVDNQRLSRLFDSGYQDYSLSKKLVTISYADNPLITSIFDSSYKDFSILNKVSDYSYQDYTGLSKQIQVSYQDHQQNKSLFSSSYNDLSEIASLLSLTYESRDIESIYTCKYYLLSQFESLFTTGYESELDNLRSLYLTSYALNDEDVNILTGSCWIELNGQTISVSEVSINADEGSVYYQCSATIINEVDYRKFVVDSEFTVHLFNDEYRFLVDSKNLSRSIDDEGHLSLQMTIEGLSPVVRYAAPRSLTITKTWETPTLLSAFIEELIGPVDYQVVDDYLPAYRLSAENAIPLELAKSTIESIGALIESLPDGTIKVRKLWPTSIVTLHSSTPDHTLNDDKLFAMSESPENNDWRNKFRILDVDASVQDTLEFVEDEDNDLSGTLYAYPSPWRDGLTLRHTRGTPIYLGPLSEELVEMTVNSDNEVEPEIIEFQEGEASTRYPIETILSFTWLAADLGAVAFTSHTKTLKSSSGDGYSLAQIRYTSRRLKARTSSSEYTSAQYLLEES